MRSRFAIFAFLLLALTVSISFIDGDDPLKVILTRLEKFRAEYPQEKVHLQLDKPFYAIGDDIWFKAYVVNAESHQLSGLSKILNVELINEQDSVKKSLRLPLIAGVAWGDFHLTDSLQEGNYRIRAYTNYMRNFDNAYFFDQTIQVGNAFLNDVITTATYQYANENAAQKITATINYMDIKGNPLGGREVNYAVQAGDLNNITKGKAVTDDKGDIQVSFLNKQGHSLQQGSVSTILTLDKENSIRKSFPIKATSNESNLQFFPEGGNLVDGLRSRVAFKTVGADGLGKEVSGYVSTGNGEKILEFKSEHAGMGVFILQPLAGQSYTATVKFPDGSEKKISLPQAQPEGFVLSAVNADSTNLLVRISASPAMMTAGGQVTLVAQSNSVVKFVSQNKLESSLITASIPKSRFPTGILQLTLFNQQNQPVAERLVFINHHDFLNVGINGPKTSAPRKKVKMELEVNAPSGKPVFGSFSVAVTDATKVPVNPNEEHTILSDLLLISDIKGYVEQPNYYFTATSQQKVRELDNLLLTQGWRRFTWKAILANDFPQLTYKPEDGINISGYVTLHKKPVAGGKVILMSSQKGFFMTDTLTDADGRFVFNKMIFPDSTRFIVQARTVKDKKFVDIRLDSVPPQLVTKNKNAAEIEVNVNKKLISYLENNRRQFGALRQQALLNRNIMLHEVKITAQQQKKVKGSASLAREANFVFHSDDFGACTDILSCLQGRVPGLILQRLSGADYPVPYLMRSMNSSLSGSIPMSIYLDGVPIDPEDLEAITPFDIEGVEVLMGSNAAIYGMHGLGGVLIITTKIAGSNKYYNPYTPGLISYMPKGYYQAREFYMPDYDDPKANAQKPDLRTTIFWQPNVVVKNGKASFEYFNADSKGPYNVTIEGIDANGSLARYVYNYTIN